MIPTTLVRTEKLNETTYSFWLKPSQTVDYTAGQFVEVSLPHDADDRGTHRWFTLSSSPTEECISITTRRLPRMSTFKQELFKLQPGDQINISQVMGDFVLPIQHTIPIIFLVRGIGITPVRSMLKFIQDTGEARDITLFYLTKTPDDFLFEPICRSGNTRLIHETAPSKELSHGTLSAITALYNEKPAARIYVSGPEQFVETSQRALISQGVKATAIVTDYFHGYEN